MKPTVSDLYTKWQLLHKPKLKPETARGQESQWNVHIIPSLGDKAVASITDDDIAYLHAKISKTKPHMANRVGALLSSAFRMAERRPLRWRKIGTNPCRGIERNRERPRKRHLTSGELQAIGQIIHDWEKLGGTRRTDSRYFRLLMLTGARKNEILHVLRTWLDLTHGALRLPDSKTGAKVIALPKPAVKLIGQIMADDPENDRLFPERYNPYTGWALMLEATNIKDLRIHDLRHTFASVGLSMGKLRLEDIGALLGHNDLASTQRYAHLMAPQQLAVSEVIGGLVEGLLSPSERAVVTANT